MKSISPRRALAFVFVGSFLACSLLYFLSEDDLGPTSRIDADSIYYYAYLPSVLFDGDLDFSNQYAVTGDVHRLQHTPDGRPGNMFGVGVAIYSAPWFALGHGLAKLFGPDANGYSRIEQSITLYSSLFFTFGAVFFAFRLLRRHGFGDYGAAAVAALIALMGSMLYYAIVQPGYAHAYSTFWIAWLIDHWDRGYQGESPRSPKHILIFAALIGAAVLSRTQLLTWGALLGAVAFVDDILRLRRSTQSPSWITYFKRCLWWTAGALLALGCLVPQFCAWKSLYGSFIAMPQGEGFMQWGDPQIRETLFSPRNGLLTWAPLYWLALVGLGWAAARRERLGLVLFCGFLVQLYVNSCAWDWYAGASYGARRFDSCYVCFAYGFSALILLLRQVDGREWKRKAAWYGRISIWSLSSIIAVGNLQLIWAMPAAMAMLPEVRPAHQLMEGWSRSPFVLVMGAASRVANIPAKAHFSFTRDAPWESYDYLAGRYWLKTPFPTLHQRAEPITNDYLVLKHPYALGLEPLSAEGRERDFALAREGYARIFAAFNRHGWVEFSAKVSAQVPGLLSMKVDGKKIASGMVGSTPVSIRGRIDEVNRGVCEVELTGPKGFLLEHVQVHSTLNAIGKPHKPPKYPHIEMRWPPRRD